MRATLWFLGLFGVAVAIALFAGNNQGTITVFWPPYRIDFSLNLVLLLLALLFFMLHMALSALAAFFAIPGHARSWRVQHQERAMNVALLDALLNQLAGRFIRAKKAAELVLEREAALRGNGETLAHASRLRVFAHLLAAESAQSLQDKEGRAAHFKWAVEESSKRDAQETQEGLQLRAARWAVEDHDPQNALALLKALPQGVARRTVALRLRLKAARMARETLQALETARLLGKHRAFSPVAALGIRRGLALELVATAHDPDQLRTVWAQLDDEERLMPEVAIQASSRLLTLGGDVALARHGVLPIWEQMLLDASALTPTQRVRLIRVLENSFTLTTDAPDGGWLVRIEQAQRAHPGDAMLQYLAGMACQRLQLWGKAHQLLRQALPRLQDAGLERSAWQSLAELAEQRGDTAAAAAAWQKAAKTHGL